MFSHQQSLPLSHTLLTSPAEARNSAMDTLLSPAESHAFQNFLSAMDYQDISPSEWALYSANGANIAPSDNLLAPTQTSEALAKATKDLMSLDPDRWTSQSQQHLAGYSNQQPQHQQHYPNAYPHRQAHYTRRETFPFLTSKTQMQPPILSIQDNMHNQLVSPSTTSTPTSTITTPATPHSPFDFLDLQSNPSMHLQHTQLQLAHSLSRPQRPPSPGTTGTKRSSPGSPPGAPLQINKRLRPSPPASSTSGTSAPAGSAKQSLLSPSQKKANHIQSEQKRRANIRRGYEALCETVPALREAIREEEEAEARMGMGPGSSGKPSRSKRKKRDDLEREKLADGRAGPRSENVVLSKSE